MSYISSKKRFLFENQSKTLEEVFLFLCRNLANAKLSFDNLTYTLQQDSLKITFQLDSIWGKSKTEFLTIETLSCISFFKIKLLVTILFCLKKDDGCFNFL